MFDPTNHYDKLSLQERIEAFKSTLIACATGKGGDNYIYKRARTEIMTTPALLSRAPKFVRTYRDLGEFWQYIKERFQTYAERREFLRQQFAPLLDYLEGSNEPSVFTPEKEIGADFQFDAEAARNASVRMSDLEDVGVRAARARNSISSNEGEATAGAMSSESQMGTKRFDVVVVCALDSPELESVMRTGEAAWERLPALYEDPHIYHHSKYKTKQGNSIGVIAGAPTQMGLSASAVLATKMILRFRPKLVAMVGIAAGVNNERQGYGNILAADATFDYGAGKVVSDGEKLVLQPDPNPLPINTRLKARLNRWSSRGDVLDEIYRSWRGGTPDTVLKLHVGPLGSGAAVIDARQPVHDILHHWRKLVGVEMEAYAVHRACHDTIQPEPMFLGLKSICDFAQNKTDAWQAYAAYTAAEFCYRFLIAEWEDLFPAASS